MPLQEPDLYDRRLLGSKMYFKKNTWHGGPRMATTESPRKVMGDQGVTSSMDFNFTPFPAPDSTDIEDGPRMTFNEIPRKVKGDEEVKLTIEFSPFPAEDSDVGPRMAVYKSPIKVP